MGFEMGYKSKTFNEYQKSAQEYFDKTFNIKDQQEEEEYFISKEEVSDLLAAYQKEAEESQKEYQKYLTIHMQASKKFIASYDRYLKAIDKLEILVERISEDKDEEDE